MNDNMDDILLIVLLVFQLMFCLENMMNDNQVLGVLFSIAVVTILLIGAGLGLFVYWLLG